MASRREIERMIAEGRIAVDGKVLDTAATILPSLRGVTVDGQPVKEATPTRLFRFHKPAGTLTAERDPKGRPTIYDRLPKGLPRLIPVGRLDYNTEGLLLLTTDGELKRQLELPSTGVERVYRARAFGEISQEQLEELIHGVEIEGMRYGAIDANLERRTGRNQWIEMRLKEGKNREVRRVLEHLGLEVSRLIRTAYGPFALGDLPVGAVDEIRAHDLIVFRNSLKGGQPMASPIEGQGDRPARAATHRARPRPPRRAEERPARTERPAPPAPRAEGERRPAKIARPARPPRREAERSVRPEPSERPARPSQRLKSERAPAKPSRPARPPRTQRAAEAAAAPEPAAKPKRLKRGEGWAKPKRPSSRPTPRGSKRGPTRGRPDGGKK